jgi:hypothetical protein
VLKQAAIYGTLIALAPVGFSALTGRPALALALVIANYVVVTGAFAVLAASGRQDLRLTPSGVDVGGVFRSLSVPWHDVAKVELRPRGQQVWIQRRSDRGKEPVVLAPFVYGTTGGELYELLVRHAEGDPRR